jgi:hypothetical protein
MERLVLVISCEPHEFVHGYRGGFRSTIRSTICTAILDLDWSAILSLTAAIVGSLLCVTAWSC